jgi:thiol-disulfide isomerase/thioredoxin
MATRVPILLALSALALPSVAQQTTGKPADWVGKPMPGFRMQALQGDPLTNESLKGKAYIVDFWATWCGPCKKASPLMQSLHNGLSEKGLVVIGANAFDGEDGKAKAGQYAKDHGYTYHFTYGNDDLATKLNVSGIPAFFFVGKDGVVRHAFVGYSDASAEKFWLAAKGLLED